MCDVPFSEKNHFDFESDLIKSLLARDTSIVYSPKIDSLLEEFTGELVHIDPIPPGINETNSHPKDYIRFIEKLLYDDTSSEDDSFEYIDYVEASPPDSELVSLEEISPTIEENGVTRTKKYAELSAAEKIQADCDMKATNIILQGDDPIACLNKAMAFLTAVASSRVIVQQVQRRQGQSYFGTGYKSNSTSSKGNNTNKHERVVKCYNYQGEGHMTRQFTQPKQPRYMTWYKEKAMLTEAQEAGQILDEEQLAFLTDSGVSDGQDVQTIIPNNAAF
nr:hypothetical protein [Tanacetum cinerariifolium]